jgi:hypothetical protein
MSSLLRLELPRDVEMRGPTEYSEIPGDRI